jgi:hypothetical protein
MCSSRRASVEAVPVGRWSKQRCGLPQYLEAVAVMLKAQESVRKEGKRSRLECRLQGGALSSIGGGPLCQMNITPTIPPGLCIGHYLFPILSLPPSVSPSSFSSALSSASSFHLRNPLVLVSRHISPLPPPLRESVPSAAYKSLIAGQGNT